MSFQHATYTYVQQSWFRLDISTAKRKIKKKVEQMQWCYVIKGSGEAIGALLPPWYNRGSTVITRLYNEHFWSNQKEAAHTSVQKEAKKSAPIVSHVQAIHLIVFHYIWYFSPYICFLFC